MKDDFDEYIDKAEAEMKRRGLCMAHHVDWEWVERMRREKQEYEDRAMRECRRCIRDTEDA